MSKGNSGLFSGTRGARQHFDYVRWLSKGANAYMVGYGANRTSGAAPYIANFNQPSEYIQEVFDFGHSEKTEPEPGSIEDLHNKVIAYAEQEAEKLERISNRKRNKFNTATVAYDASNKQVNTRQYYYGRNNGIELNKCEKNVLIFGDSKHPGLLPEHPLNHLIPGNCAEIHAVTEALNDGVLLSNLVIYTIDTTKTSFGKEKESCENCTYTLKGRVKINYTGWKDIDNAEL